MASAITRAAAAAALRRTAVLDRAAGFHPSARLHRAAGLHRPAGLHRAGPLQPPFPRFSRPRYCYRTSQPPDEQVPQPTVEDLERMDKEALVQYAKRVTLEKDALLKRGCRYGIESDITMSEMKQNITEMSSRMEVLHKSVERRKDLTSISISNSGSINLLAVGMGFLAAYQAWVQFS